MSDAEQLSGPSGPDLRAPAPGADVVRVGLVQLTEPLERLYYMPYTIGVLQSYVLAHAADPARYQFLKPIYLREPLATGIARFAAADVAGFSAYVWNIEYSLALAARLKAACPETLIVFGGPQIPEDPALAEEFLRAHPFIDLVSHGEGEVSFLRLLEAWPARPWAEIKGLSWLEGEAFKTTGKADRTRDLDTIPSPYLSGFFDPILADNPHQNWVAIWETNRGCPFSCSFCDWGTIKSKVYRFDHQRVLDEIDWFGRNKIEMLWSSDANFGMLPRDLDFAKALVAAKKRYGYPRKALLQMTKNHAERTIQTFATLAEYEMITAATLSLQSVTPRVLKAIRRENISLDTYGQLLKHFVAAGIPTYTELLIGLPGESFESFLAGVSSVITQGQHEDLRFYNAMLLPNAEMASPEYRRAYGIEGVKFPVFAPNSPIRPNGEVQEMLEMIVASETMSRADWIRMRNLAWLTQVLYYGKFLQLPLLLIQALTGIAHSALLMAFLEGPLPPQAQVLPHMRAWLRQRAEELLAGGTEVSPSRDLHTGTPIWLANNDMVLHELLYSPALNQAYAEAHAVLEQVLRAHGKALPEGLLIQALVLAQSLFQSGNPQWKLFRLSLGWNLWSVYGQLLRNQPPELIAGAWQISHQQGADGRLEMREVALAPH